MINMQWLIYLTLIAVGFYFGKWLGAIGLVTIYFSFFHSHPLKKYWQSESASQSPQPPQLQDFTWAYQELGIAQSADNATVKQARKRLLNHYHPDKLGPASADERRAAERKVNAINRAFAAIKQARGFD